MSDRETVDLHGSDCPAEAELAAVASGAGVSAELRAHVLGCRSCTQHLESLREVRGGFRELRRGPAPSADSFSLSRALSMPDASTASAPIPVAIGRYRVLDRFGSGGQAVVYRAYHPDLGKEVVIKLSRFAAPPGAGPREKLLEEGRVLAQLDHPGLSKVHDFDFHDGCPFLVLELKRGRNLLHFARDEMPSPRESAALVAGVAKALESAHRLGIVHKDIKPLNIIVDEEKQPCLIDFGIAWLRDSLRGEAPPPGEISGTLEYMAPEQARGESDEVGPRSDIFALGGVLYDLLVGRAPFSGESAEECLERAQRCDFDREALRGGKVPRRLRRICLKAMEVAPGDRHQSAGALASELEGFLRRRRRAAVGAGGLLLLLLAALVLWLHPWADGGPRADRAPSPSFESRLGVQVFRDGEPLPLSDALPLHTADKLQVRFLVPEGLEASLLWRDTEGVA